MRKRADYNSVVNRAVAIELERRGFGGQDADDIAYDIEEQIQKLLSINMKRWEGEVCKRCGRRNPLGFNVRDIDWASVVGNPGTVWCLTCFDEEADRKDVRYQVIGDTFPIAWWQTSNRALSASVTQRALKLAYRVWVEDDGYTYDDAGNSVFIGEEYAGTLFDLRDLNRSDRRYWQVLGLIGWSPERRSQLALAAAATGDAKSTHFLVDIVYRLHLTDGQVRYLESVDRKLRKLADRMPEDLILEKTKGPQDASLLRARKKPSPDDVRRLEPFFAVTEERPFWILRSYRLNPDMIGKSREPVDTAPSEQVRTRLAILDRLLVKKPNDGFLLSLRAQLERGKTLSERQLSAIRRNLYQVGMRTDAEAFRPPT